MRKIESLKRLRQIDLKLLSFGVFRDFANSLVQDKVEFRSIINNEKDRYETKII